jgi:hypothetical protein
VVENLYRFRGDTSVGIFEPCGPSTRNSPRFAVGPVVNHEATAFNADPSSTCVEDENSGRIAAATSAGGQVSHQGWGLFMRALNHGSARYRSQNQARLPVWTDSVW